METMHGLGSAVGEYVGGGQGESESEAVPSDFDAEPVDDHELDEEEDEEINDDTQPLLLFYDCESTGLSIYNDHLTDIAAKVVGTSHSYFTKSTFASLIKTSRHIPAAGILHKFAVSFQGY